MGEKISFFSLLMPGQFFVGDLAGENSAENSCFFSCENPFEKPDLSEKQKGKQAAKQEINGCTSVAVFGGGLLVG